MKQTTKISAVAPIGGRTTVVSTIKAHPDQPILILGPEVKLPSFEQLQTAIRRAWVEEKGVDA